ncbi:hypothetical protein [Streptomyces sp. MUM 178J]|uniref:hypothetical protein n=1 Tax=Streptomyces sp. MUM 178J TaxID=2791991 RepID=UPI001F045280|nr:hypothetical protein [Streptomyces sp. MUM 178J]WRQ82319.1 hypothetical protein I3F59_024825 [Streptomyces sp. MUM 178J]
MGARSRKERRSTADPGAGRVVAAFASLGAAAIHFAAAPDHFAEWWAAGLFFYATGAFQAGWAVAALRFSGRVLMGTGLVANAGAAAVWAVSRTAGMPVGPGAGVPEETAAADVTAVVFEVVICLVAAWRLRRSTGRGFASPIRAVALAGVSGAAVMGLTVPAVQGALSHSHGHGTADESTPHGHGEDGEHGDGEPEGGDAGQPDGHKSGDPEEGSAPDTAPASATPAPHDADTPAEEPAEDAHGHDDDEPHGH